MQTLVSAHNVSKFYDGVPSLSGVSIEGHAGSIHAVTGENGAGKSTLMKVIAGVVRPSAGELFLRGQPVSFRSPLAALDAGISTVFQEFSLVPNLSVAETMFLGREIRRSGLLDRTTMEEKACAALQQVGMAIDPRRTVSSLTVAEQQSVEIAKGLTVDAQVFIFDEPTAALSTREVEQLEQLLFSLRDQGKCIFYISHRMREIFTLCDTATVLKDGRLVGSHPIKDLDQDRLLGLMVGRDVGQLYPPRREPTQAPTALEVKDLRLTSDSSAVAFHVRQGEIVGLAGLEGQGQREMARALVGIEAAFKAEINITSAQGESNAVRPGKGSGHALESGLAFMPEDRKGEGLYLDLPIHDNLTLGVNQRRWPWMPAKRCNALVDQLFRRLSIRAHSPGLAVGALSGGNQQKVMLGRWLAVGARVLVIEEPTRGVDVGAKTEIYDALRAFCDEGGAVLFTSRELPEVIGLADRILVVNQGEIVAERLGQNASEEDILQAAVSRHEAIQPEAVAP